MLLIGGRKSNIWHISRDYTKITAHYLIETEGMYCIGRGFHFLTMTAAQNHYMKYQFDIQVQGLSVREIQGKDTFHLGQGISVKLAMVKGEMKRLHFFHHRNI